MTWKAKRRFYDHGKARVIEIGEVIELDENMLEHAKQHDLIEAHIEVRRPVETTEPEAKLSELTKAELLAELDHVSPGHEFSMKDSKAELQGALTEVTQ